MVSYEVSIGIIIINVLLCVGSLNLKDIVLAQKELWYVIPLFPMFVIFFISALAETNRPPFDLPEASGKSKGGLLVSANAEIKKITNIGKRGITYHNSFCAKTMSFKFNDPTHNKTLIIIIPIETS